MWILTADTSRNVICYVLECECGNRVHVRRGDAGSRLACSRCDHMVDVPALSVLRVQFPIAEVRDVGRPFQYSIAQALSLITLCAVALAVGNVLGYKRLGSVALVCFADLICFCVLALVILGVIALVRVTGNLFHAVGALFERFRLL